MLLFYRLTRRNARLLSGIRLERIYTLRIAFLDEGEYNKGKSNSKGWVLHMDKSILSLFRQTVAERNLGVCGVHVYQKGKGEAEHRFVADDWVNLYSGSKTFSSVGVGICQDEGGLKLSDSALSFFPEYKDVAAPGSDAITLRDMLHMSSGKELPQIQHNDRADMDWAEIFFREPMTSKPGEKFYYSNFCTYMLGRVIEKASGEKTLRDYLVPRLFDKLGIVNPQWLTCPGGHTVAASCLILKTSDFAKLGRMLLQRGEYDGKRVVSADYVDAMHNDAVSCAIFSKDAESSGTYGYQVWNCTTPGVFRADGLYGQFSIVIPEKNAVVTTNSHNEFIANDIIRAIFADIVPYLD
jgi:CubicO group peptidase (beta-lactamase class C family)